VSVIFVRFWPKLVTVDNVCQNIHIVVICSAILEICTCTKRWRDELDEDNKRIVAFCVCVCEHVEKKKNPEVCQITCVICLLILRTVQHTEYFNVCITVYRTS
jgi:hypothetical protein